MSKTQSCPQRDRRPVGVISVGILMAGALLSVHITVKSCFSYEPHGPDVLRETLPSQEKFLQ